MIPLPGREVSRSGELPVPPTRSSMRRALFAAVAVLTLACDKTTTGPEIASRLVLVRLNGLPLPFVRLQTGTAKEEVLSGEILLRVDGSYRDRTVFRSTQGSVSSTFNTTLQGPYQQEGSTITFTVISDEDPTGDDKYTGTFVSDTLVIQAGTTTWKYVER
jgi:hypothetical protein